jgi:hypothetical protein
VTMPTNIDQAQAYARGQRLAESLWVPDHELASTEDEIEARYHEAELAEPWDLRGWFCNGFEQRWDRRAAIYERTHR